MNDILQATVSNAKIKTGVRKRNCATEILYPENEKEEG